jgi:hypothetical protein
MTKFINAKYDGNGVRPFIQKMISIVAKINKYLGSPLHEDFCGVYYNEVSAQGV